MLNVSKAFRRELYFDRRQYICEANVELKDGTTLLFDNTLIMHSGVNVDDAVSNDNSFTALGAAIINSAEITVYNNDERFSEYVFTGAKLTLKVGLNVPYNDTTIPEMIKKGTYIVDDPTYGNATIKLPLLDYMANFDRPYSESQLTYPATLAEIVRDCCYVCGVTLNTYTFPHSDFVINDRPSDTSTTCREVISWVATIAGCFARCNVNGELELKWFNTSVLENTTNEFDGGEFDSANPYATGVAMYGGSFNPWDTETEYSGGEFTDIIVPHYFTGLKSQKIAVDDVVITGVQIKVKSQNDSSSQDFVDFSAGTNDYVIKIENNPLITVDNAPTILEWLRIQLIGLRFRPCDISQVDDPSIEAGDVGFLWDNKGKQHSVLVTRATFHPGNYQTIVCGAESPAVNSATRFSQSTKAYVEMRDKLVKQRTAYEDLLDQLAQQVANASGLYKTDEVQQDQSIITYYHNKPNKNESDIQIVISDVGITVTSNGTSPNPTWYGLTVNGDLLARILSVRGINADWIRSGTLTLGGADNGNGILQILDENENVIGTINNTGANLTGNLVMHRHFTSNNKNYDVYGNVGNTPLFLYQLVQGLRRIEPVGLGLVEIEDGNETDTFSVAKGFYGMNEAISTSNRYEKTVVLTQDLTPASYTDCFDNYRMMIEGVQISRFWRTFVDGVDTSKSWGLLLQSDFVQFSGFGEGYNSFVNGTTTKRAGNSWSLSDCTKAFIELSDAGILIMAPGFYFQIKPNYAPIVNGRSLAYASSSSKRYKHDIKPLTEKSLDPHRLYELVPKQFIFNDGHPTQYDDMKGKIIPGFIAEDVEEIYPSAVIHDYDGNIENWDERRIIPGMLALIQEQHEQIKSLEKRLQKLESIISTMTDDGR